MSVETAWRVFSELDNGTQNDILKYKFVVDLLQDMPDREAKTSSPASIREARLLQTVDMVVTCQVSHTLPVFTVVNDHSSPQSSFIYRSGGTMF
jgi:hypothetical protein